jgi:hypothetical protein
MDENTELNMYDIECENINEMLRMKQNKVKENVPVNIINDEKYRELRGIILKQKQIIQKQADEIALLKSVNK